MTLTLSLPPEAERRLRERAREAGQEVAEFVRHLIDQELAAPSSLVEAAEPLARAVEAAGLTDDEFTDVIVQARDESRRERRSNGTNVT